jgi:hypothetical protein
MKKLLLYFVILLFNIKTNAQSFTQQYNNEIPYISWHKEGVDNAVKMFMQNPPGQLDYRIKQLENKVSYLLINYFYKFMKIFSIISNFFIFF